MTDIANSRFERRFKSNTLARRPVSRRSDLSMNPNVPLVAAPFHVTWTAEHLIVYYQGPAEHAVYVALDHAGDFTGTSYVPSSQHFEGSTTYLSLKTQRVYFTTKSGKVLRRCRRTQ